VYNLCVTIFIIERKESIMAFIDEFKKNAAEVADRAKKKTTEITNIAKINLNIKSNEAKLAAVYEEIGRLFYSAEREGVDNTADIAVCIMKADKFVADIAEAKKELAKLRKVKTCGECGAELDINFAFCNYCGAKQEMPVEEPEAEEAEEAEEVEEIVEIAIEEEADDAE